MKKVHFFFCWLVLYVFEFYRYTRRCVKGHIGISIQGFVTHLGFLEITLRKMVTLFLFLFKFVGFKEFGDMKRKMEV